MHRYFPSGSKRGFRSRERSRHRGVSSPKGGRSEDLTKSWRTAIGMHNSSVRNADAPRNKKAHWVNTSLKFPFIHKDVLSPSYIPACPGSCGIDSGRYVPRREVLQLEEKEAFHRLVVVKCHSAGRALWVRKQQQRGGETAG